MIESQLTFSHGITACSETVCSNSGRYRASKVRFILAICSVLLEHAVAEAGLASFVAEVFAS